MPLLAQNSSLLYRFAVLLSLTEGPVRHRASSSRALACGLARSSAFSAGSSPEICFYPGHKHFHTPILLSLTSAATWLTSSAKVKAKYEFRFCTYPMHIYLYPLYIISSSSCFLQPYATRENFSPFFINVFKRQNSDFLLRHSFYTQSILLLFKIISCNDCSFYVAFLRYKFIQLQHLSPSFPPCLDFISSEVN